MSTERQANASRANGAKSRGPVTPEGKRTSSRNATTHGMLADAIVMEDESEDRFRALLTALHEEFKPRTPFEESLIENMAVVRWRQIRIWEIEKAGLEFQMIKSKARYFDDDDPEDEHLDTPTIKAIAFQDLGDDSNTNDHINRYETRYERHYLALHRRFLEVRKQPIFPNEPEK